MTTYQFVVRVQFRCIDDIEARRHVEHLLREGVIPDELVGGAGVFQQLETKLQRLEPGKPPVGLPFGMLEGQR